MSEWVLPLAVWTLSLAAGRGFGLGGRDPADQIVQIWPHRNRADRPPLRRATENVKRNSPANQKFPRTTTG